jgi:CRP/FNR family nitrogen fixation transcriptional regulator
MNTAHNIQTAFRPPAAAPVLGECAPLLPIIGPRLTFSRGEEIFAEGKRAEYVFQVLDGVVRTCRFLSDGHRQIEDFHMAGEYFGLVASGEHACTAEAVGQVRVLRLRRAAVAELARRDCNVAARVLELTLNSLARAQQHVAMLGRKSACERLAAFLADFAQRSGAHGVLDLPMSRQEIADYLGLTIETVSRTFSQFEADGVITLQDRRRVVCDFERLDDCCA